MIKDKLVFSLKNPVIAGHSVHGQAILPGLAYIDILLQCFRKHGYAYEELVVKNITIHHPLLVENKGTTQLTIEATASTPGSWKVALQGNLLYATAEVSQVGKQVLTDTLDLAAIKSQAQKQYPISEVYEQYQGEGLLHSGLMRAEGRVYETAAGLLFNALTGKDAETTANYFLFHPALIDASAVATRGLFDQLQGNTGNLFLPLYYGAFQGAASINQHCYAWVPVSAISRKGELITLTIHYYNEAGSKIAELTNLTSKMVRPEAGIGNVRPQAAVNPIKPTTTATGGSATSLIDYLKQLLATYLNTDKNTIEEKAGYYEMGLHSASLLQITADIGQKLGIDLPPTILFEYPNIALLAAGLSSEYALSTVPDGTPVSSQATAAATTQAETILSDDIAIIGVAGKYPQADNLQAFWENLQAGRNCITEIPASRWDTTQYAGLKSPTGKNISVWGGFINDPDCFDPRFFRISAREAELMDPQERLFLETCWAAMEDAGYTPETLVNHPGKTGNGKVGVFAGVMHKDYTLIGNDETMQGDQQPLSLSNASIANRVSYYCDFNGPSMVVDTVCSSSLTAVHLALQNLRLGECEVALAGGVNLSLHPAKYLTYGLIDMHSSEGICRTFGKGGDGYVSAEGVGAIVLKPLKNAVRDKDQVYAVIKGSSVNHVGSVSGITVPSPVAQAAMIRDCLDKTGIDPRTISYMEAHGTGTSLGDPIEIQGLKKAFAGYTTDNQFCAIGSVKSNIGHAEAAAGISGLTKVLLQFKYKTLVPSLHATELNPYIDLAHSPFFVQQATVPWNRPVIAEDGKMVTFPRRAGISSFGASGANVHILLEEYDYPEDDTFNQQNEINNTPAYIIPFSAKNKERLVEMVRNMLHLLNTSADPLPALRDMAYTLQTGRVAMEERVVFVVNSIPDLTHHLKGYLNNSPLDHCFGGNIRKVATEATLPKKENVVAHAGNNTAPDLIAIAKDWAQGGEVNWATLYAIPGQHRAGAPRRVSLPAYPFARESYWIGGKAAPKEAVMNTSRTASVNSTPTVASTLLVSEEKAPPAAAPVNNLLLEKTVYQLKALFAGIVKYPVHQIDDQEALENYGIDSIMIVELNKQLAVVFGELPATLFYQYQSLGALAGWLVQDHYEQCISWTGVRSQPPSPLPAKTDKPAKRAVATPSTDAIAIIGISGRYPQAGNLDEYWDNLRVGKDCITEIPADRWAMDDFFHADSEQAAGLGKSYGKWGGFIDELAGFDARFFNISPKEARGTDPQARLFLETCWQALEDAGYTRATLKKRYNGNVGVYAGVTRTGFSCYADELMKHGQYVINATSAIANRVSYFLNLRGPSVPVDTMCSSSLTSVHYAVESLLKGECAMALAGGVNLLLHPSDYVLLSANNFLSTDGRCRSFGEGGTGYVPGEGVGAVLLKPLSKAIADKDHIYAVIKGSSINHGGKTNGYTVPNPVAQGDLIRDALNKAQVNARAISYVEAHGTGTMLGDPIEIAGLTQAFSTDTSDTQYCAIGSAKSNIGHLEAAAGIAGITKIVLQMKHGLLAPSLHAASLNPNIQFNRSPFVVQQSLSAWERPVTTINGIRKELPRIAGISSFGAGGSNAHMILEEYMPG